jgi:phenylpropionate dioxygenase-like ring-hydroxylating dioxygenase large terminal subunit
MLKNVEVGATRDAYGEMMMTSAKSPASNNDWHELDAMIRPDDPQPEGWYAVALASEVETGQALGCDFLGGRVVVYRRSGSTPVVLTARCPHMGADLSLGDVIGDDIRCTYHHFCFGADGACTSIPSEGAIPAAARVHSYPAAESLGLIWAYNGETPLFPPPTIRDYDESDLLFAVKRTNVFEVAPWLSIGNTFDFMHLRYVHGLDFEITPEDVRYVDDYHIELEIPFVSPETGPFEQRIRVTGTNAVSFLTVTDHTTIGLFTSTPIGHAAQTYYIAAVPKDPSLSHEELEKRLAEQQTFGDDLLLDDARTLTGIKFKVGTLVADDRAMATYLQWIQRFPRALSGAADR